MNKTIKEKMKSIAKDSFGCEIKELSLSQLYELVGKISNELAFAYDGYCGSAGRRAAYFSAEFLMGRLAESNLLNLGIYDVVEKVLNENSRSLSELDDVPDYAFGNGGLGRLAACFMDSAASQNIKLDGYGIRYKYGLFRQEFKNNAQCEKPDNWNTIGDPFGICRKSESVIVKFSDFKVRAVPYDYYIIGYKNNHVNRLRLYDCESLCDVDFEKFNEGDYNSAYSMQNESKSVSAFLYPNDNNRAGKILRLRQQYFFTSAALQNILHDIYNEKHADEIEKRIAIQLNDTHPVIAIPEFIRLLECRGQSFEEAFRQAKQIFSYTNHTVMSEALEKWDESMFRNLLPDVYDVIKRIDEKLRKEIKKTNGKNPYIIFENQIHMANLACYVCSHINGVAAIHSDIIARETLSQWHSVYPERFSNKTNGITQRRWLALANTELYETINKLVSDDVALNLEKIKKMSDYKDDKKVLSMLDEIRRKKKTELCEYIGKHEKVAVDPDSIFFVHAKRIHEYKRQLLCALAIVKFYRMAKCNELDELPKMTFIFAGKAAPGYKIAKSVIRYINSLAKIINNDESINGKIKVVFISNYNVSLAQKIFPAADYSLQISQAGTEASGTGNMKLMLNGAVTIGTYDGANIEIVREAGKENNYIFGLDEPGVKKLEKSYDPKRLYEKNSEIKRTVDSLIDTSFFESPNEFEDIYSSLLRNGRESDKYMVLADYLSFTETILNAASDYKDREGYLKKSLLNIASSSFFSSDRTIREYSDEIWHL